MQKKTATKNLRLSKSYQQIKAHIKRKISSKRSIRRFRKCLRENENFFSKDYEKVISDNTLSDIEKISDKVKSLPQKKI